MATIVAAQLVALVLVAQTPSGVSAVKLGEFLSMGACRAAASGAEPIGGDGSTVVLFECVPLSPVSGSGGDRR